MKDKGFLICFVGIDGSGKTTLAKKLVEMMVKDGIKSKYIYNRFIPLMLRPIMMMGKKLFLRGENMFDDYAGYSGKTKKLFKNRFLSAIYQDFLLFDYFFQVVLKVKIPLMLGKNIVCDRYVYDTIITDLAVDLDYSIEKIKKMIERYLHLFPKPDLIFLIDVPEEVAYQRKDDVPSIDYLKERRKLYLDISEEYGMVVLDGCKDLTELKKQVQKEAFEYIKRGDIK